MVEQSSALSVAVALRTADGRFADRFCGDPNCCGQMVPDVEADWRGARPIIRCDGLTHLTDDGPLIACERWEYAAGAAK